MWIVPSIVEEKAPSRVGTWDHAAIGNALYYRVWQFKFAPFALFSRVMVRVFVLALVCKFLC